MASWFCDVGGMMTALRMVPLSVQLVAMVEETAGRLGGAVPDPRPRLHGHRGALRFDVFLDDPDGLVAGGQGFDRSDHDALEGVAAGSSQTRLCSRLAGDHREAVLVQRVTRERAHQVPATSPGASVQGGGVSQRCSTKYSGNSGTEM